MADISRITLPSGTTYDIKDTVARQMISGGVSFLIATDASTTPKGVKWHNGDTLITGTLEVADAQAGAFYLVRSETQVGDHDVYDEYVPVGPADSRIWEKIGDTEADIDLSNYAKKGDGISVSSISGTAASKVTGISLSAHSVSSATFTNGSVKVTATGGNSKSAVTISPKTTDVYSMTSAGSVTPGSANTPTSIDTTKFSGGSLSAGSFSGGSGSFTQGKFTPNTPTVIDTTKFSGGSLSAGSFSGGSGSFTSGKFTGGSFTQGAKASFSATVADETLTLSFTANGDDSFTPATHGADSHTHTAATHTQGTLTPASFQEGFYTAGTAASHEADVHTHTAATHTQGTLTPASFQTGFYTAGQAGTPTSVTLPGRSTAIKAWTGYNTGEANTYAAAQTFTGTEATGTATGTVSVTIADHTITDNGHTHTVSGTGSGTINS